MKYSIKLRLGLNIIIVYDKGHGDHGRHQPQGGHHAAAAAGARGHCHARPHLGPDEEGAGHHGQVWHARDGRGGQVVVAGLQEHARQCDQLFAAGPTNPVVLGHLSLHRRPVHQEAHAQPVRDQSDGGAHTQGHHPVLCLRAGEAEGPLLEHLVL